MINTLEYQISLNQELDIIKNRVRNLIGDAHWGEDGRYKEEKLKQILKTRLPQNLSVGTGFILNQISHNENIVSKQIDIIVYENNIPPIFIENDFVIVTQNSVKAIIEVKSNLKSNRTGKEGLYKAIGYSGSTPATYSDDMLPVIPAKCCHFFGVVLDLVGRRRRETIPK